MIGGPADTQIWTNQHWTHWRTGHITSTVTAQYNIDNYYEDGSSGDYGDEGVSLFQLGNNNGSGREEEGMHERQQSQSDRQ